jgi:hypothetical protein
MLLFDRVGRVDIIGDGEAVALSGLRFDFSVTKTRSDVPNAVTLRLVNPSPDTRKLATDINADLRIYAGYQSNVAMVTEANIIKARTVRAPPEVYLEIDAQEGIRALRQTSLSITHSNGATVQQVLDEIVERMGVVLRPIRFDISQALRGGFAHVGKPAKALDDLVRRFGGSWSIQNGELQVLDATGEAGRDDIPLFSPSTGLLYSPETLQENLSSEKQSSDARNGFRIISLMRPDIEPGHRIRIESADVQGEFIVDEVTHKGDIQANEWYSEIVALEGSQ